MSEIITKSARDEKPVPHWVCRAAFSLLTVVLLTSEAVLAWTVYHGWTWASIIMMLVTSHFMHGQLIGFHEASHGVLRKNRRFNEFDGVLIGLLSFTSFSLYRAAHQTHHAHLGKERDEELWPFVDPKMPRWARVGAAFLELFFGLLFTPLVFVRTFLRAGSPIRNKRVRRRIWMEFGLIAGFWIAVVSVVAWLGLWKYFFWMYLGPAFVAANLQSWRKYIEHVGLTGATERSATRSIVAKGWQGQVWAFTLLHEPFHGVHHQHAGLTHAELPYYAEELEPTHPDELPPFPTYRHAMWHLVKCLADPKVGAQWREAEKSSNPNGEAAPAV